MVILTGAIILTLNNNGIINKASDAVEKTNLKQVQQIASLAWAEAYTDGVRTVEDVDGIKGFQTRINEALEAQEINLDDYTITVTTAGVTVALKSVEIIPPTTDTDIDTDTEQANLIPEGATYTTGAVWVATGDSPPYLDTSSVITYTSGQEFPETPQILDRYVYGDYVYVYNANWMMPPNGEENVEYENWAYAGDEDVGNGSYEGWQVAIATDLDKTSYGEILESVNGKPVMSMEYTFYNCTNLSSAPTIPDSVTDMYETFYGCNNLSSDDIVIPVDVNDMTRTFFSCYLLYTITVNSNPEKYEGCFSGTQIEEILGSTSLIDELKSTRW